MVGKDNSTILTVSYGTFSCTLEGFDDSFGMMKAIAEYFRDLASDDRYFGAEPPTLDTDMLAKIAEREVSRKVEARSENGGVVLRPYQIDDQVADAEETIEAAEAQPAPIAAPAPVAPVAKAPVVEEVFVEESDAFFGGTAQGAMLNEESVAARLQRIREAARNTKQSQELIEDEPELEAEVLEADILEVDDEIEQDEPEEALIPEILLSDEEPEEIAEEDVAEVIDAPVEVEEDEMDIANLMAMDGLETDIDNTGEIEDSDDEAEAESEPALRDAEDDLQSLLGQLGIGDETIEASSDLDSEFEVEDEAEADIAEEVELEEPIEADEASVDETEDQAFEEDAESDEEPIQARILHVKGAVLQDMENFSEDDLIGYDDDAYEAPENEVDAESLNAIFDTPEQLESESSLSDEEEADLMRELAEAEADEGADDAGEWDGLLDADTEAVISDGEHLFTEGPEKALASAQDLSSLLIDREADEELNRLMAETETQLSEPEHTRRKTTIQHLKAAFAARRADGNKVDEQAGNDSVVYRDDLELAVKPRRPVLAGPRKTARLESTEAAPLKLVAAQKIVPDENLSEPSARPTLVRPVRPRRVRAGAAVAVAEEFDTTAYASQEIETEIVAPEVTTPEVAPQEFAAEANAPKVDFQTFTEHMGAYKLPELLEAAASYVTFIEGLEKFSRPQVMTLVRLVLGDEYTREDGLRSFGQLLREGKLIRLSGGRFTVSDGIGYQPN